MAHEIDSMMWTGDQVRDVPWHGLGLYVGDQDVTSDEAIAAAGLDWTVSGRPVYINGPDNQAVAVPGYQAITRDDNQRVLSIMSDGYRFNQNHGKFSFFDEVVGQKLAIYHTAMSLDEGRRIAILAKLPKVVKIPGTEDITEQYLLLADSFDGSVAFTMAFTGVRVVCANTMNMALSGMKKNVFRVRHTVNMASKVEEARRAIGMATRSSELFEKAATHLAATKYTDAQMKELAELLYPDTAEGSTTPQAAGARGKLLDLFENGRGHEMIRGSAWAGLNAVAEFADHYAGTRKTGTRSAKEAKTMSVLFGAARDLKQEAAGIIYRQMAA